jgi:transcriptional regulator with XRE-family HTH domain
MKTVSQLADKAQSPVNGSRLRKLREKHGLSLRQIHEYTGVHSNIVSIIERDATSMVMHAITLARFFETTVEELFGEDVAERHMGPEKEA